MKFNISLLFPQQSLVNKLDQYATHVIYPSTNSFQNWNTLKVMKYFSWSRFNQPASQHFVPYLQALLEERINYV